MSAPEGRERRLAVARRRRLALAGIALVAAVAGAIAGSRVGGAEPDGAPRAQAPSCPADVARDPRRLAGQMLVARMEATATPELLRAVRRGEIGGVVLFPPAGTDPRALGREVEKLRRAARKAGAPAPLVSIDQEGGEVERLPSLPPDGTPSELAARGTEELGAQARATGRALSGLGIDVDLAPVLDVPTSADAAIASRSFGDQPAAVGDAGTAFITGLQDQGVAATAKHFPGLGAAVANTDLEPVSIDVNRAALNAGLEPFSDAIAAGVDLVMVANATYPVVDAERPASLSRKVIEGTLRKRLGYSGVVITDDLGAGALTGAGYDEGETATGAAAAGADLLLFALSDGSAARAALVRALRSGELSRPALEASCARNTALRESLASAPG